MNWRVLASQVARPSLADETACGAKAPNATQTAEPVKGCAVLAPVVSSPLAEAVDALRTRPPPEGLSEARWSIALDRASAFVLKWGDAALALGWSERDLLGVDYEAWMRLDRRGALFLMVDAEIVSLTAHELVVRKGRTPFRIKRRSVG